MEIKRVPISEVEVWDKNPRNIKTKDFERLKRQIQELGVYKPLICIQENGKYITLGGNMRLRALQALNLSEVDISIVTAPDEATRIKYALSDNDRAGEYDEQALAELTFPYIGEINLEDYKIDVGESISLESIIEEYGPDRDEREDEIPEMDDSPAVTKTGDLFKLGRHRLLCGDATKEKDAKRLMRGEKADMVFTDPPFNVDYGAFNEEARKNMRKRREKKYHYYKDDKSSEEYFEFTKEFIKNIKKITKHNWRGYIWYPDIFIDLIVKILKEENIDLGPFIIWVKDRFLSSWRRYHLQHELCVPCNYANATTGPNCVWFGPKNETTVWEIRRDNINKYLHPTQKPIELPIRAIKNSSRKNDIILDIFLGSGSTLIASEKLNRRCFGMDIEPKYCDVIITRYANFTGIPEEEIRTTRENPDG